MGGAKSVNIIIKIFLYYIGPETAPPPPKISVKVLMTLMTK